MTRRLAAIMAADIAGYSRLIRADEAGTIEAVRKIRERIFEPIFKDRAGRVVKLMGDGLLVEFPSVVDAVEAAVDLQERMEQHNADLPASRRIAYRIGVNLGDVVVEGDDIHGDGVNLAARLEKLATPGGLCVSDSVHEQVRDRTDLLFVDMGEQHVKNIDRPVRAWQWCVGDRRTTRPQSEIQCASRPTLIVLPFANGSGDPQQSYFCQGLTESITTALSCIRRFPVISSATASSPEMARGAPHDAARSLGARFVLDGSVQRTTNSIRVTVHLTDLEGRQQAWAEKYDRPANDLFEIQDDIASHVAAAIEPQIEVIEIRRARGQRTDTSAWDLYLQGLWHLQHTTCEGNSTARTYFQRALDLASDFGEAWSGLARSLVRDHIFHCSADTEESLRQGLAAARRGVELNDDSSQAHSTLGYTYLALGYGQMCTEEFHHALRLNPYNAQARMALGNQLDLGGDFEGGLAHIKAGLELSPFDPYRHFYMAAIARALATQGAHEEALAWAQRAVSAKSDDPGLWYRLALAAANLDRIELAREALQRCESMKPGLIESRRTWRPYDDDHRNALYFGGARRHDLIP